MLGAIGAAGATLALKTTRRVRDARLVLIDADLSSYDRRRARAMVEGAGVHQLKGDLVWQWRRELRDRLAGGRAVALVRWDKALLLTGLARETGLAARQVQISRSLFRVDIG